MALDWYYGTDMFLSIDFREDGKEVAVTIDLTMSRKKEDVRPDFLLSKRQLQSDAELNTLADKIVMTFLNRQKLL